jgi:hypothetical protein
MPDPTAQRKTPRGKGRPWVALHTTLLLDPDMMLASNAAWRLMMVSLLWSADQGQAGRVIADPRKLNLFCHLEGGPAQVADALSELRDLEVLVDDPDGDDGYLYVRSWDRYQSDFGGSTTRSGSSSVAKFTASHEKGNHEPDKLGYKDGCPLCQAGAPAAEQHPESADEPDTSPTAGKMGMREAQKDFRDTFEADLAEHSSPFEGYVALLKKADDFAELLTGLSKNPRGALRNDVLAHAIHNVVDEKVSWPAITRANSAAKALGDDGHKWWVHACVLAAGKKFENEDHLINWMTTTAQRARAKQVAA